MRIRIPHIGFAVAVMLSCIAIPAPIRAEVFDFDTAPIHTSLPIDLTVGTLTAHFSATGQGFSIQPANTMGFTPTGFGGLCIYPNSVFASDLTIGFSAAITDFSILYAPQELGCDDPAIMRVTAYSGGVAMGSATATAPAPGTWPTGTLGYAEPAGFDQVLIHYDHRPLCTDYGPIFMADVMTVTPAVVSVPPGVPRSGPWAAPNPFHATTQVAFVIERTGPLSAVIHDAAGRAVRTLAHGPRFAAGPIALPWDGRDDGGNAVASGMYFCRIATDGGDRTTRVVLRR